jgi:uncharacterized linocin/CFP29 family protein
MNTSNLFTPEDFTSIRLSVDESMRTQIAEIANAKTERLRAELADYKEQLQWSLKNEEKYKAALAERLTQVAELNEQTIPKGYHERKVEGLIVMHENCVKERDKLRSSLASLEQSLNQIGILIRSEHAYTSEFTERVRDIVEKALSNP